MTGRHLLLVDDDAAIVAVLSTILRQRGFAVTAATTVAEALQAISTKKFEVLVTDLNIGQPGDGFTVVSAIRRVHPEALAIMITGFPAFDEALQAIREQVDEFLLKPVHPERLVETIERTVRARSRHRPLAVKRVSDLIREHHDPIIENWIGQMNKIVKERYSGIKCQRDDLVDHLPVTLHELCLRVDQFRDSVHPSARETAVKHGRIRRRMGFDTRFLLNETSTIRQEIIAVVHQHLLLLNMSHLFTDLAVMSRGLDDQLEIAVEAFFRAG